MALDMFSKRDKLVISRKWSIATRLSLLYTFAAMFVLFVIGILLYCAVTIMMVTAEKQYLIDEVFILRDIIKNHPNDYQRLEQEVNGVPAALKNASYYYFIHVIGPNNKTILQTPGMHREVADMHFPPVNKDKWSSTFYKWRSSSDKPYLLMSAPLKIDQTGNVQVYMHMALDCSYPQKLLNTFCLYIFGFFIIFVFIFLILGKFISKRALQSLYEMVSFTKRVTASNLSNRIEHKEWPKELTSLGSSFNSMMDSIEKAFNILSECTNELAHELRMPVNNLIVSTEIILSRQRTIAEYQQLLESNLEEFRRLSKLSDNILFLARTESLNTLQLNILDLQKEATKVCEFYKTLAAEKNIVLKYDLENLSISADQLLLQRALANLINNAIKYTKENGHIQVSSRATEKHILLSVTDNGIGISDEHLEQIFDRFYRIEAGSLHEKSWGLGLAIVKKIMTMCDGYVTVSSEQNKGSNFTLYFPRKA